jgi:anti-sigma B factor antagonist
MSLPHPRPIPQPAQFRVVAERFEPAGGVLTVTGELDVATVPQLRARLATLVDAGVRRVVIDLLQVEFLDSIAIAALLHAARELGHDGRLAVAVAPDSYVRMVFEIAGLPQCLDVVATRAEALARVSG